MMTPEQRYFFDVTGYLHLKNVLSGEELKTVSTRRQKFLGRCILEKVSNLFKVFCLFMRL